MLKYNSHTYQMINLKKNTSYKFSIIYYLYVKKTGINVKSTRVRLTKKISLVFAKLIIILFWLAQSSTCANSSGMDTSVFTDEEFGIICELKYNVALRECT